MYSSNENPVLVTFREHLEALNGSVDSADLASEWLSHFNHYWLGLRRGRIARVGHVRHAKRVFRKLANH